MFYRVHLCESNWYKNRSSKTYIIYFASQHNGQTWEEETKCDAKWVISDSCKHLILWFVYQFFYYVNFPWCFINWLVHIFTWCAMGYTHYSDTVLWHPKLCVAITFLVFNIYNYNWYLIMFGHKEMYLFALWCMTGFMNDYYFETND